MRFWLLGGLVAVLLIAVPCFGQSAEEDSRLKQPVHVTVSGIYVSELLNELMRQTRVTLEVNDRQAVSGCRVAVDWRGVTLEEGMRAISAVLGEGYCWVDSADSARMYTLVYRSQEKKESGKANPVGIRLCDADRRMEQIPPYAAIRAFREAKNEAHNAEPMARLSVLIPVARRVTTEQWKTLVGWESEKGTELAQLHPFLVRLAENPQWRQAFQRGKSVPLENLAAGLEPLFPGICRQLAAGEVISLRATVAATQNISLLRAVFSTVLSLEVCARDNTVIRCETVSLTL